MKAFLPGMLRRNNGHIVTIASAAGLFGVPALVDYCARYPVLLFLVFFIDYAR